MGQVRFPLVSYRPPLHLPVAAYQGSICIQWDLKVCYTKRLCLSRAFLHVL